jgi:hypothetical protein
VICSNSSQHFDENTHYPVDLQWRDIRARNASVRSRGTASRNPTKPGFEIDFDHYTTGQQFLGLRAIILDNLWQDPAMIRKKVAMAFFNRMGEAAPRESFARLYINNTYRGVYAIVERIDAEFLARTGADRSGYLFEYRDQGPFYGGSLGDELTPDKDIFEPRTHKFDADTILYSPIRDLFQEVSGPDDARLAGACGILHRLGTVCPTGGNRDVPVRTRRPARVRRDEQPLSLSTHGQGATEVFRLGPRPVVQRLRFVHLFEDRRERAVQTRDRVSGSADALSAEARGVCSFGKRGRLAVQ